MRPEPGPIWGGWWGWDPPMNVVKEPRYQVKYKDRVSPDLWTLTEACQLMRAIPYGDSIQLLLTDGQVHFTLPPRIVKE